MLAFAAPTLTSSWLVQAVNSQKEYSQSRRVSPADGVAQESWLSYRFEPNTWVRLSYLSVNARD